jgi:hypothetical protein
VKVNGKWPNRPCAISSGYRTKYLTEWCSCTIRPNRNGPSAPTAFEPGLHRSTKPSTCNAIAVGPRCLAEPRAFIIAWRLPMRLPRVTCDNETIGADPATLDDISRRLAAHGPTRKAPRSPPGPLSIWGQRRGGGGLSSGLPGASPSRVSHKRYNGVVVHMHR